MSMTDDFTLGTVEGLAAWLYGFLSAFTPVDDDGIDDDGSAEAHYDAALAMLRRMAGFEEIGDNVEGTGLPDEPPTARGLWWATRRAVTYGRYHAHAATLAT